MMDLTGKKILILGGAAQHCKVVEAAHKMGLIVYVTDYLPLEKAPAKQLADVPCYFNFPQVEQIVDFCKREHIDGVLNVNFEAPQKSYREICSRLGLPCFGTEAQYEILTNKSRFKECCKYCGVDTIPEYTEAEITPDFCDYPVLVKPAISHGSRGISICRGYEDAVSALRLAREESENGEILIEKYMGGYPDFTMTYLVIDGEPILVRTADRFLGSRKDGMDRSCVLSVTPSFFTEKYAAMVHPRLVEMIQKLGIRNAPIFMQGFVDGNTVRFYDPGLRFSGSDYELAYRTVYGFDLDQPLIHYALTGSMGITVDELPRFTNNQGRFMLQTFLVVRPGRIAVLDGVDTIRSLNNMVSASFFYRAGDVVGSFYNARQRLGELIFIAESFEEIRNTFELIFRTIAVKDECGDDMLISPPDPKSMRARFYEQGIV